MLVQDRTHPSPGKECLFLTFRICLPTLVNLMTTTSRHSLAFACRIIWDSNKFTVNTTHSLFSVKIAWVGSPGSSLERSSGWPLVLVRSWVGVPGFFRRSWEAPSCFLRLWDEEVVLEFLACVQVIPSYELGTAVEWDLETAPCCHLRQPAHFFKEISARTEAGFLIFLKKRLLEKSSRKHSWGKNNLKINLNTDPGKEGCFEEVWDIQNC